MAVKVELDEATLREALEAKIASVKRASNNNKRPEFAQIYQADLNRLQNAINTLSPAK